MGDIRQTVGYNLRRLRHAKKLSQEKLALEAGLDRAYISQLENGVYSVSVVTLDKIAKVLRVDAAELLKAPPKDQ